jgi:hypothetical protein
VTPANALRLQQLVGNRIVAAQVQRQGVPEPDAPATSPNPPDEAYVDNVVMAHYDISYRRDPPGAPSKWVQVIYADATVLDINIDDIVEESMSPADAQALRQSASVGDGGRLFPDRMNDSTTPRLAAARRQVLQIIDDYNTQLIMVEFAAAWAIVVGAAGSAGKVPPASRRPSGRVVPGDEGLDWPPRPALPPSTSTLREFGELMKWGRGHATARARIATLTRQELVDAGVTPQIATEWRDFYVNIARLQPSNPSAAGRAELMQRAVDLLSGP